MAMNSLTPDSSVDRLRTIISYDRICVMDNGNMAEFDAPDVLYAQNGIFRAMCEQSGIMLEDIRGTHSRQARDVARCTRSTAESPRRWRICTSPR